MAAICCVFATSTTANTASPTNSTTTLTLLLRLPLQVPLLLRQLYHRKQKTSFKHTDTTILCEI